MLRAFVVAPAAIVVGLIVGAGTLAGVILFAVAGIMLVTAIAAFYPTYTVVGSRRSRGCIASATVCAAATPRDVGQCFYWEVRDAA
jgi:hypothetical protein